ncbi:MAG: molybdopterin cofactor-binding domain-containing protein [Erythrobacter sp.]|jgi:isoquinoline 1-oxidoreductase beta subunit|uniref:molybdopterin cofactor-binding domain-containing protein n=1 Tax=Erythrobacter sp. TaxID=1042 RepID=UPI002B498C9C|nr:molybdopterin cofactor-binding domain-containing protein [Erythrobacter sp.]WRH69912.1 MAG: molybdopterin cofactor-binding domain-containing protein [Erythrobacter sp.]
MAISRRGLLAGAAAGGGLLVAWWLMPRSYRTPLVAAKGEQVFGAWLKIANDGVVTVAVPQLEMGQGITTLLPQIVAYELGADWRQIAVEPAPVSGAYANIPLAKKWIALWDPSFAGLSARTDTLMAERFAGAQRFNATADGMSLAAYEMPCRMAAAAARAMLAQEAASRWGVTWEECEVEGGFVTHGKNRASFGELAEAAAEYTPPDPPPLRPEPPREKPLPADAEGEPAFPRLDLPSKVDGSYRFAGDVRLPGMVFAAIRHGPTEGSMLAGFNVDGAAGIRGLKGIVESKRWLAVAADTWWSAQAALDAMKPRWTVANPISSNEIAAKLDTLLDGGEAHVIAETGQGGTALQRVDIGRRYEVEPAYAAPVETASAAARYADGRLDLWIATQAPEQTRIAAARAIGISTEDVALYPMPAGGSFDARLEHDHAIEIALIAQELGVPVQLTWPRRDEMIRARPRAPAYLLLGAQLSRVQDGAIEAFRMRIAAPSAAREFGHRLFGNLTPAAAIRETTGEPDPMVCEGAVPPYQLPAVMVEHIPVDIGLPVGRVRGNAYGPTIFAIESFVDEIAAKTKREPLSFRMAMLGGDVRLAACLQRAAQLAGWDGGVDQSGQGLAVARLGEGDDAPRIACVATARQGEGGVRVIQLSAAVDIGRIVNHDIARQQIEGGLVFGIGIALGNPVELRSGVPEVLDYEGLGLPTLADCPEIRIEFIASNAAPADPGELGAVVAPPAIANALFSATGLRLRRLPLLSDGI